MNDDRVFIGVYRFKTLHNRISPLFKDHLGKYTELMGREIDMDEWELKPVENVKCVQ